MVHVATLYPPDRRGLGCPGTDLCDPLGQETHEVSVRVDRNKGVGKRDTEGRGQIGEPQDQRRRIFTLLTIGDHPRHSSNGPIYSSTRPVFQ